MSRLLNAEFSRFFKSKIFWLCAAVPLAQAIFMMWQAKWSFELTFDLAYAFFNGGMTVIFCSAVFSAIFFSGGDTVRNKLIVGHKKSSVYFSNVIISITAAFIFQLLYTVPVLVLSLNSGIGFSESTVIPEENAAEFLLGSGDALLYKLVETLDIIVMAAIFALIMALIRKKVIAAVASIIMIFGLIIMDNALNTQINTIRSKITEQSISTDISVVSGEEAEKLKSDILTLGTVRDFIPLGQLNKISRSYLSFMQPENPDIMPYFTIVEFFLINAAGVLIFRRKDIK